MTASPIAAAINHLLAQDPAQARRLAAHAGKVARVNAGVADLRLKVESGGMLGPAAADAEASVSIFIAASDLPRLLQDRSKAISYVRIEGDADFANTLSQLMNGLRWDAEEDLARLLPGSLGEMAAVRLVDFAKRGISVANKARNSMMENVAEYLLEENPTLVRQQDAQDFSADVADLRDDVERLAKRIERIANAKGRA